MKRFVILLLAAALLISCVPAQASSTTNSKNATLLSNLTHNCTNTGIMLPEKFSPKTTTYLLTVASWVSSPRFTPTAYDPEAVITVNGKKVQSGKASQVIPMSDKPQAVKIVVTKDEKSTTYTIYLQRRPSEKRTKVSAGYINSIYQKNTTWMLDPDLVTVAYQSDDYTSGNLSTFTNKVQEVGYKDYVRELSPNCLYYYGTSEQCYRARNLDEFLANYKRYDDNPLYTIVYIEDKIVALFPYEADY